MLSLTEQDEKMTEFEFVGMWHLEAALADGWKLSLQAVQAGGTNGEPIHGAYQFTARLVTKDLVLWNKHQIEYERALNKSAAYRQTEAIMKNAYPSEGAIMGMGNSAKEAISKVARAHAGTDWKGGQK